MIPARKAARKPLILLREFSSHVAICVLDQIYLGFYPDKIITPTKLIINFLIVILKVKPVKVIPAVLAVISDDNIYKEALWKL